MSSALSGSSIQPPHNTPDCTRHSVAILLSVYNGEAYLPEQLASFLLQTHTHWHLYWRDDGSNDASRALMERFAQEDGAGRCTEISVPGKNLGATRSFMALLRTAPRADYYAFSDQDDVWLPQKLEWALQTLTSNPTEHAHLYCARQILTDHTLAPTGESAAFTQPPTLYTAMSQNIASGMTIVFNNTLRDILRAMQDIPPKIYHDWWALLVTCATGGVVSTDSRCVLLYRQHNNNCVGASASFAQRALGALQRGRAAFLDIFETNRMTLQYYAEHLTPESQIFLHDLEAATTLRQRLSLLKQYPQMRRQGFSENSVFRLWYLCGNTHKPR